MNRAYRVVWNGSSGIWQVASEIIRGRGKTHSLRSTLPQGLGPLVAALAVLAASLGLAGPARAADLPTGGRVVAGSGSISQSGTTLTVTQTSSKMAAEWQSFNIGQGHTVNFVQPSSSAAALNRVLGSDVSVIQGALKANGQIFLVNPNGILFTPTAQVNVGGIVASTLNMSTADFMAGNYMFEGASANAIVNQGNITAVGDGGQGGSIALIAAKVINQGSLSASAGNVMLGAGSRVTLDMGGPVKISVEQGALDALIAQGGAIQADGGLVYLTAKAAGDLASTVINHTGVTQAQTLASGQKGEIVLLGGMDNDRIAVGGTLDASAPNGGDGGFIETSAAKVSFADGVNITTAAPAGATGQWLIDPVDFTIAASGGDITGAALASLLNANSVTIHTAAGTDTDTDQYGATGIGSDINVNDAVTWDAASTLTLHANRNININADITASNADGKLQLEYGQGAVAADNTATYNIGNGVKINLQAGQNFTTKLGEDGDYVDWTVITALGAAGSTTGEDLQGISGSLAGHYVLGADIDASATGSWNLADGAAQGFSPLGSSTSPFSGSFDGLGHVISNLYINRPTGNKVGLFGYAYGATIRNVGLVSASVTGSVSVGALVGFQGTGSMTNTFATGSVNGSNRVGGLVGSNEGSTISTSYATGSVSGSNRVGGLVGYNSGGSISGSYATGSVLGDDQVGGLVGYNLTASSISGSYATGSVTGTNKSTGGLVGSNEGSTINTSYATGSVYGKNLVGGLVGYNLAASSISGSYATGSVTGTNQSAGGLVGSNEGSTINTSYATGSVYGKKFVGGLVGQNSGDEEVEDSIGSISYAYASGLVSGTNFVGGLVGSNDTESGSVDHSYWNAETTEQAQAAGNQVLSGATGLTMAQMRSAASFDDWSISGVSGEDTVWRIYEGSTAPLLRSFLTTVVLNGGTYSQVYNGTTGVDASALSWGKDGAAFAVNADYVLGLTLDNKNVGARTVAFGSLYSSQQGYDFADGTDGALTVNVTPKALTVSGITAVDKTYDGTNSALVSTAGVVYDGLVEGDSFSVSASGVFDSAEAGVGRTVALTSSYQGGDIGNYTIGGQATTTASINPRPITVAADDKSKVAGQSDPAFTWHIAAGELVGSDSLSGSLTRSAGESVGDYAIFADGLANSNYLITPVDGVLVITAAPGPNPSPDSGSSSGEGSPQSSATAAAQSLVFSAGSSSAFSTWGNWGNGGNGGNGGSSGGSGGFLVGNGGDGGAGGAGGDGGFFMGNGGDGGIGGDGGFFPSGGSGGNYGQAGGVGGPVFVAVGGNGQGAGGGYQGAGGSSGSSSSGSGSSSNGSSGGGQFAGVDANGFLHVFVVNGGINLSSAGAPLNTGTGTN